MPRHSIYRDARGRIDRIEAECGSEACPIKDVDDDGGVEYRCADTDAVLVEVDPVEDVEDPPDDRRPATTDERQDDRKSRRG